MSKKNYPPLQQSYHLFNLWLTFSFCIEAFLIYHFKKDGGDTSKDGGDIIFLF